jgi:hypothetical protein
MRSFPGRGGRVIYDWQYLSTPDGAKAFGDVIEFMPAGFERRGSFSNSALFL